MTRTDKSMNITSIGKTWLKRHPEFRAAIRTVGPVDINARRCVYEDGNHNLRTANPYVPFIHGGLTGPNAAIAYTEKQFYTKQGPCKLVTQSSIKVGGFKVSEDGRVVNFIKNVSGGRTVLAATNGEDDEITVGAGAANDEILTIVSNNTADTTQIVTIYGIEKTTGAILVETATLNGTTAVDVSTSLYNEVLGSTISATALGTTLIKNKTSGTTLISHATTVNDRGIVDITAADTWKGYDGKYAFTISALEAVEIIVEGYDLEGVIQREILTWTAANEALVKETLNDYSRVTRLILGDFAVGKTIAVAGVATNDMVTDYVNNAGDATIDAADKGANGTIEIVSDEAADVGMKVKVAWKNAAGAWTVTEATLNGTTQVQITAAGDTVVGAFVSSGTPTGSLTIAHDRLGANNVVLVWDTANVVSAGMLSKEDGNVAYSASGIDISGNNGPVTVTNSNAASTIFVYVLGEDIDGTSQGEGIVLVAGTLATTNSYSRILHVFASGAADTEYTKLSNETVDIDYKRLGHCYQTASAQDTEVECEFY